MFVFINMLVKDLKQFGLREREPAWLSNGVGYWRMRGSVLLVVKSKAVPSAWTLQCPNVLPADWGLHSASSSNVKGLCIFLCRGLVHEIHYG